MKGAAGKIILTVLALAAAALQVTKIGGFAFDWEAMVFVGLAFVPWLAPFVESFKLGKDSFEIKLREIEKKADAAIDASLRGVVNNPALAPETAAAVDASDLQKGRWGGSPRGSGRTLSARVEKIPGEDFFHRVLLRVAADNPAEKPLTGKVVFYLHPTFKRKEIEVKAKNNAAETSIVAYGAFTVGAAADDGATKLELDLTALDDGRNQFFKR